MNNNDLRSIDSGGWRGIVPDAGNSLDLLQLQELEGAFREWAKTSKRTDIRRSRLRILLIFLIIRYTGARLNEVFHLDLMRDFSYDKHALRFGKKQGKREPAYREVQIPERMAEEIKQIIVELADEGKEGTILQVDPAHVRRKFYEQAEAVGLKSRMGSPETIRKSRAVELIRSNMPLPVVQKIMGHSTPNPAASYVEFSDRDLHEIARYYSERENTQKTSARNSFFGKVSALRRGDIQTLVEVISLPGNTITAIITNSSLTRLGLHPGMLITAEVKAPMIQIYKGPEKPRCSAENIFPGRVQQILGKSTTVEVIVQVAEGVELCAIMSEKMRKQLRLHKNDEIWSVFDAFAVVLRAD